MIILAVLTVFNTVLYVTVIDSVRHSDSWLVRYAPVEEVWEDEALSRKDIDDKKAEILSQLGDYETCRYNVRTRTLLIFTSYAATIVADYSGENYARQKEKMLQEYQFITSDDTNYFKYEPQGTATEWHIKQWRFCFIKEDGAYIPEDFRILALNDETQQIALLTYHDQDMDVFGEKNDEADLVSFLDEYFKYNFEK